MVLSLSRWVLVPADCTYSLSDNGCDKCICSLSESSNVISVVSKAQWKPYILKCMKSQKSNVCYHILESAWLLYFAGLYLFHGEEYIYWPAVVSIGA